jgi:hypothetical protein
MRLLSIAAIGLALASPAAAHTDLTFSSRGNTYFNRPGATKAQFASELRACYALTLNFHQPEGAPSTLVVSPRLGLAGAVLAPLIVGAIQQSMDDFGARAPNLENCMVVKGWRVIEVSDEVFKTLQGLNSSAKAATLAEWEIASEVHGKVVRLFANDAALKSTVMYGSGRRMGQALGLDPLGSDPDSDQTVRPPRLERIDPEQVARPLMESELGGIPKGSGLVVVNVGGEFNMGLMFDRQAAWPTDPASKDGLLAEFAPFGSHQSFTGEGATFVFALPPGRWRLASVLVGNTVLSLCLGGPAFELKEGEALYLGSFRPQQLVPDMDLSIAKGAFPAFSPVPDKLKPASWINGAEGACGGTYIYALEMPGRPFADGYAYGSIAQPRSGSAAPGAASPPIPGTHP